MFSINIEILPTENECLEDYAFRLYRNQTMFGLSNEEIGSLLDRHSGESKDESAWRKMYKVGVQYYDKGFDDGYDRGLTENPDVDASLLQKEIRLEREKNYKITQQMRDVLREYRAVLRFEARSDNLIQSVRDTADIITESYPLINPDPIIVNDNREGVLLLSDWHYGEVIDDFTNKYNHEIFMERIETITSKTIEYVKSMGITKLKVLNLGDLISGDIHVSTRVNNEEDLISQVMTVAEVISQMLTEISMYTNVEFFTVTDNHSRTNKSKVEHVEIENYQRIIPFYLKSRMKDNKNVVIVDQEDGEVGISDVLGEPIIFTHGHNDRTNSINELVTMTKTFPIGVFMGHFHHHFEKEDNEIDLIVNPSLIGSGVYSKTLRKVSKPRQKLLIYNKINNQVGLEMVIHLDTRS